jgi:transcriptional regulator with XRE-family HTH domain
MTGESRPGSYLKEWRKFRGLTQREVVARLVAREVNDTPATEASLSRLETGRQPYSQPIMEALSEIYGISVGQLIDINPLEPTQKRKSK